MSKFKVGDRVRINCELSIANGDTGIIIEGPRFISTKSSVTGEILQRAWRFLVACDSTPNLDKWRGFNFLESELEPLVPPDELAWQKFREHLKPNPLVIFDADPITVSTEHEAEAIADRVPNSHIIVAIYRNGKRIVLSEYYGRSETNRP